MIPILYEAEEKDFLTNGLGRLTDAASCTVTEERNGQYELEMTYPADGVHFADLAPERIILAEPSDGASPQPFRIYAVSRPLGGVVTVNAHHISYLLNKMVVMPFEAHSAAEAMEKIESGITGGSPFTFWTDKASSGTMVQDVPVLCRPLLGGSEGSVLDAFGGGEYEFDRFTVKLHQARGSDSGVTVRYGKNLTMLQADLDWSGAYTSAVAYWRKDSEVVVGSQVKSGHEGEFAYPRCAVLDMSQDYEEAPSAADLDAAAKAYLARNTPWLPSENIDISFVELWQSAEYAQVAALERVRLCDIVSVEHPEMGVSARAKVVRTVYDVLAGRYSEISLGDARASFADRVSGGLASAKDLSRSSNWLEHSIAHATELIRGGLGGHVVIQTNADGKPEEILIMDTDDITTATKVWRWNMGGFGYSSTGYSGNYGTAITMDGVIVADFIKAGTMLANRIKGGVLSLGGADNGDGTILIRNSGGTQVGKWDNTGITATAGKIGPWSITSNAIHNGTAYTGGKKTGSTGIGDSGKGLGFWAGDGRFSVTQEGKMHAEGADISGSLTATAGKIGPWKVTSNAVYNSIDYTGGKKTNSTGLGDYGKGLGFWAGDGRFSVTQEGKMHAEGADISGSLTATTGKIGGWTLSSGKLYAGDSSTGVAAVQIPESGRTWVFAAGGNSHDSYANCPFRVSKDGKMYATAGKIGPWEIATNAIYNGTKYTGSKDSNSTGIGDYGGGWAFWAGNGKFSVKQDGSLHAESADITGTVKATSGSFGSVTINGCTLQTNTMTGTLSGGTYSGGRLGSTSVSGTLSGGTYSSPYLSGGTLANSTGGTYIGTCSRSTLSSCSLAGTSLGTDDSGSNYIHTYGGGISIHGNTVMEGVGNTYVVELNAQGTWSTIYDVQVNGDFKCYGVKDRAMRTRDFGTRLLSALESPVPTFCDFGSGRLDESGECLIQIDPVLAETVSEAGLPLVFLTPYGEGSLWVDEARTTHDAVVIRGTPGLAFAWETRYQQADCSVERLRQDEIGGPLDLPPDYGGDTLELASRTYADLGEGAAEWVQWEAASSVDYGAEGCGYYEQFEQEILM